MLPRPALFLVVAFWLAMMGWLCWRDVWPEVAPGEPPRFVVELAQESRDARFPSKWTVTHGASDVEYDLDNTVDYREADDSFLLLGQMKRRKRSADKELAVPGLRFHNLALKSFYHITRAGNLRDIAVDTTYQLSDNGQEVPVEVHQEGEPHDRRFRLRARGTLPADGEELGWFSPEPVEVSMRGLVLNPFQPLGRTPNLREGQSWRVPVLDPFCPTLLAKSSRDRHLLGLLPEGARTASDRHVAVLRAEVLAGTEVFGWHGKDWPCWQVRYASADEPWLEFTTWVRVLDGLTLQQDVVLWGEHWDLRRDRE